MPREDLDHVPGRKRDVEEETNLAGDVRLFSRLADGGGGQHEVVIMDPNDGNIVRVLSDTLIMTRCVLKIMIRTPFAF